MNKIKGLTPGLNISAFLYRARYIKSPVMFQISIVTFLSVVFVQYSNHLSMESPTLMANHQLIHHFPCVFLYHFPLLFIFCLLDFPSRFGFVYNIRYNSWSEVSPRTHSAPSHYHHNHPRFYLLCVDDNKPYSVYLRFCPGCFAVLRGTECTNISHTFCSVSFHCSFLSTKTVFRILWKIIYVSFSIYLIRFFVAQASTRVAKNSIHLSHYINHYIYQPSIRKTQIKYKNWNLPFFASLQIY